MKNFSRVAFLALLHCIFLQGFAQNTDLKFNRLGTVNGLSQGHVSAILKDNKGFMWFATDEGVNKYDGYRFTIYKHDLEQASSLSHNTVYALLQDKAGNLWIGTGSGLDKFDRKKDSFTHFSPITPGSTPVKDIFQDSKNRIWLGTEDGLYLFDPIKVTFTGYRHKPAGNSISNDIIYRITEDESGRLWIATKDGLNVFNPDTRQFSCYKNEPGNPQSIGANWIKSVYRDRKNNIWIGTQGSGIALFNPQQQNFTNFLHNDAQNNSISHNDVLCFAEDHKGNLWVGTENGGISVLNYPTHTFTHYQNNISDRNSLSNNSIYCIYKDDIDNLWVGTWSGGINFLPFYGEKFNHYRQIPGDTRSLSNNIILTIAGSSRDIWLGTDGGGLNRFDRKQQVFTHYRHDPKNKNSISSDYVLSVIEVEPGLLGIGYHRGGFDLFNTRTGIFTHYRPQENNPNSLSMLTVNVAFKDHNGLLWLGTWGEGLDVFDRKTGKFIHYKNNAADTSSINDNFIDVLHEDGEGNMWVATEAGLNLWNRKTGKFTHYRNDPKNKRSLSNNIVESILDDRAGNTWISTGGGLNLFDRKTNSFTVYTEKDGLSSNMMHDILEDKQGNLWISSNQGISSFNPLTKTCRNYGISDGLQGNEFKSRCAYQAPDGQMYFGGPNGLNVFYTDSLRDNKYIPPVYITEFQIFNKPVPIGIAGNNLVRDAITETKEIKLSYKQSVFTFEFAALNYTLPAKNQYAYKLEPFDNDWNYVGNKRTATYTNLDPGTYVFHVIASNNDGVWNKEGASVTIIVTPPFWSTWWFRLIMIILVAGSVIAIYRYRVTEIKLQKKELQLKVMQQTAQLIKINEEERTARMEAEKARREADEASRAKSVFLATMSHEIRTPMNGVIGMASLLTETKLSGEQRGYAETIRSCGESLLTIINDILDFSKIESGKMELEHKDFNLRHCVEDVLDIFSGKAESAGLDLIYEIDASVPIQVNGDSLRLRQVLMNLVSNAVKFTEKGEVFIKVYLRSSSAGHQSDIVFEVKDSGIGILPDKMERLFKAFSQVDSSTTRKYGGTGLGLIICEKLIAIMGGHISVNSKAGQGTCFTFNILLDHSTQIIPATLNSGVSCLEKKRVLVVDDNVTNRDVLYQQLRQWKMIPTLAASAKEALAVLEKEEGIDLILTDRYMPEIDGIALAESIRKRFHSMPVILLGVVPEECKEKKGLFTAMVPKPTRQHLLLSAMVNEFQKRTAGTVAVQQEEIRRKLSVDFAQENPLRILMVEDNPINQVLLHKILEMLGYEAALAENGKIGFEMVQSSVYDLVFMDVQMPEMDGLEATQLIRKELQQQPVIIAMTANAMAGDQEACINAGMDDYLSKPVKLDDLVAMLRKWSHHTALA